MQRRYISPQNQNTNKKEINPEEVRWIMDKIEKLKKEKQYEKYVKQKTPSHNVWLNMLKAFLLGGLICTVGQVIFHYCEAQGLNQDACSSWTSIALVLISVLLTGTGIYPKLAKWGGAGALVPITGFANSVAAPAIEYKKGRTGLRDRMQDLHHRRPRHPVRDIHKLGAGGDLLDRNAG